MKAFAAPVSASRSGFRELRVVAKVRESAIITSFYLEPLEADGWRAFEPGQFLVFRIPVQGGEDCVLRNYSVSCSPELKGRYRITVKREAAPTPDVPAGLSSCYLHDHVEVGDVLLAEGPRGAFVLNRDSHRPVVLLSGGVGLTPLVSMLHALTGSRRKAHFIHACANGDVHALRDEVEALAASRTGLSVHFCYRRPTSEDRNAARHNSEGTVSRALLQSLLPLDDYDFYLCGPAPFMKAVHDALRALGVPKARIAYEFFGPATLLEPVAEQQQVAGTPPQSTPAVISTDAIMVEFRRSGRTAMWNDTAESLLAFAEDQGLEPEFSCRAGICGACKSKLLSGDISYFEEPLDELAAGEVLLCCSRPQGSVVLDL